MVMAKIWVSARKRGEHCQKKSSRPTGPRSARPENKLWPGSTFPSQGRLRGGSRPSSGRRCFIETADGEFGGCEVFERAADRFEKGDLGRSLTAHALAA